MEEKRELDGGLEGGIKGKVGTLRREGMSCCENEAKEGKDADRAAKSALDKVGIAMEPMPEPDEEEEKEDEFEKLRVGIGAGMASIDDKETEGSDIESRLRLLVGFDFVVSLVNVLSSGAKKGKQQNCLNQTNKEKKVKDEPSALEAKGKTPAPLHLNAGLRVLTRWTFSIS
jgi:hypothetical protein